MSSAVMNRQELGHMDVGRKASQAHAPSFTSMNTDNNTAAPSSSQGPSPTSNLIGLGGSTSFMPQTTTPSTASRSFGSNIWGSGLAGLGTSALQTQPAKARTGSSALLDDSTSDSWSARPTSSSNSTHTSRFLGKMRETSTSSASAAAATSTASSQPGTSAVLSNRPPAINLNANAVHATRPSFGSNFSQPAAFGHSEKAPQIYTKFERPAPQQQSQQSLAGPSDNYRPLASTGHSPVEDRNAAGGTAFPYSMPASRNNSLPPSRHSDDQRFNFATIGNFDAASARRQSTPHANGLAFDPVTNAAFQIGQMTISNNSRPSTAVSNGHVNGDFGTPTNGSPFPAPGSVSQSRRGSRQADSYQQFLTNGFGPQATSSSTYGTTPSFYAQLSQDARNAFDGVDVDAATRRDSHHRYEQSSNPSSQQLAWPATDRRPQNPHRLSPRDAALLQQQFMQHQMSHPFVPTYPGQGYPQGPAQQHFAPSQVAGFMQNNHAMAMANGMPMLNSTNPYLQHTTMAPAHHQLPSSVNNQQNVRRSDLLSDFKAKRNNQRLELRQIRGHVVEFATDQHGSRFIQQKLETATSADKSEIFGEILDELQGLMCDVFGNYVVQKLFDHCDQVQKKTLVSAMRTKVFHYTKQMYGCRVIQKALEHVLTEQQSWIVEELRNHVSACIQDQNGNHVIQKAIECCPSRIIPFIFDEVKSAGAWSLASHPYGCRVIQRCLEHGQPADKQAIMASLYDHIDTLVMDTYGNYVVQHIVVHGSESDRALVLQIVLSKFETFSRHKFASNVVEKCITHGGDDFKRDLVELFRDGRQRESQDSLALSFVKDQFGNYVIQKLMDNLSDQDFMEFADILKPDMKQARDHVARDHAAGRGDPAFAKHVANIDKKFHRSLPYRNGNQTGRQKSLHNSRNASAERTPALTSGSVSGRTSSVPSVHDDTLAGANNSRKNSGQA